MKLCRLTLVVVSSMYVLLTSQGKTHTSITFIGRPVQELMDKNTLSEWNSFISRGVTVQSCNYVQLSSNCMYINLYKYIISEYTNISSTL